MSYYLLEDTINQFFSSCNVTREECDQIAAEITGESTEPVQIQGAFSYTVAGGNLLVQFRVSESLLDTEKLHLARKIYGDVVPTGVCKGVIGLSPASLTIYVMDRVPGITYIEAPLETLRCTPWQEQIVSDFARFFATSWVDRLTGYRPEYSLAGLQDKFDILLRKLPSRFTHIISKLKEELPILFTPAYPLVLTHADLCEMNIIVNPETGNITGIVDWAEAKILPFGMSLWGLQNLLSIMDSDGWHYHENSSGLESLFWGIFYSNAGFVSDDVKHAIKIAERAGLVLRYGFTWEDGGVVERPVSFTTHPSFDSTAN